jgi:AsmA protein
MKPSQLPSKWLLFGLLAVPILAIGLIPWLIGDTSRFERLVTAELSAWTGGEVKFVGPVRVSFLPDVSVRGQIEAEHCTRLPGVQTLSAREAKVSLDLVDLLRGRVTIDALRLLKPRIALRDRSTASPAPSAEAPQKLLASLVSAIPVRVLHMRKGRITLGGPHFSAIEDIYAHVDAGKDTGAISGFGAFTYKDATVRYSLESGAPTTSGNAESFPLTLTLTSRLIHARLSGIASYAGDFKLDGDMQVDTDDARKFLKWIGLRLPEGDSLKAFTATGAFHVAGPTLTFDDGRFMIDGNKAAGLLALTAAPRPRVEGTLAFDRLILDPYFGKDKPSDGDRASPAPAAHSPFDDALLQVVDADLRISAATMEAGALKLGRSGFTITARNGAVASEVGELELCGGSADGRLNVDLAQAKHPMNLTANLFDISLDSCLQPLMLPAAVKGIGRLKTELASEGSDIAELTGNLSGTLNFAAMDGAVPIDFARLATGSPPLSGEGWNSDNLTPFNKLDADCRVSDGKVRCESLTLQTSRGAISGAGDVDLAKQTVDWSFTLASPLVPTSASPPSREAPTVSIRGSLAQPMIRRADRPTLGEGSLPTGSVWPGLPH